ncbi:MAG: flavin reductase [Spirochaetes bacterium]|nr:flavin reductase [Spirochaetota bacterium]
MSDFRVIDPLDLDESPFRIIGTEWMLITAGSRDEYNTMTAAWGGFGTLWSWSVAFCFVRPTRYTYGFMEKTDAFSLCFFERKYKKALDICGTKSGRDTDKVKAAGLTPVWDEDTVYFDEARLVLLLKKIYSQDLLPERFLDPEIHTHYPKKDYHRMYVGRVDRVLAWGG